MDQRGIIATLSATVLAGGIAAVIGATALPDGSPYFTVLITFGVGAMVLGFGGLLLMLLTAMPATASVRPIIDRTSPPEGLDEGARAVWLLRRARENAAQARKRWFGIEVHHRAYSEIRAAILGVSKHFGVGGLLTISQGSDEPSYRDMLLAYVMYTDTFLPLLEGNQVDAARRVADSFTFRRGLD